MKLSGVEKINLHGFRHSHATMLASLTTDIKSISDRLGHESVDVTLNEYIHSNDFAQKSWPILLKMKLYKMIIL
ncbi:MAG: tyrosine-type recombinase/integrase [Coprobacillus cateniformis]